MNVILVTEATPPADGSPSIRWLLLNKALYFVVGRVLSVNAVNQITLQVQRRLDEKRQAPLEQTPAIILVDGVWVEIQHVIPHEYKEDLSGHLRQRRQVEERVVLAGMAVWAGSTVFEPDFREDLRFWIDSDRKIALRIMDLVEAVMRDPFDGIGKPEPLKYLDVNT